MSLPPGGPPCLLSPSLYHQQAYPRILKDLVGDVKAFTPYLEDREPPVLPARKDKIEHAGRSEAQRIMNSTSNLLGTQMTLAQQTTASSYLPRVPR